MYPRHKCCFLFFDYLDFDVFLNARIFYRLAGFQVVSPRYINESSLIVFFRGTPDRVYSEFQGSVHFYDYVREYDIIPSDYFPNASSITVISFDYLSYNHHSYRYVYGYLPVFPALWQFSVPCVGRSSHPIHVSNYKPLNGDSYQDELISMIKSGQIIVYGAKWDRVQVLTRPCSFITANLLLSQAFVCFGLMYPYQRGKSLSGRMWQAPIQGCIVITEENTNLFSCPGVYEVPSFQSLPTFARTNPTTLASQAGRFWLEKTTKLADDLNLSLSFVNLPSEIAKSRLRLVFQHLNFSWNHLLGYRLNNSVASYSYLLRRIKRMLF